MNGVLFLAWRYLLWHSANVADPLEPHGILGPTADGLDGVRGCANIGEHVHVLFDAVAHALECGSEQIPAGVGQAEAKNHSLSPRIVDRSSLAREIRQHDDASCSGGGLSRFLCEHSVCRFPAGFFRCYELCSKGISKPTGKSP